MMKLNWALSLHILELHTCVLMSLISFIFRAYEIEKRLSTADLFRFPNFETVCWYVGKHLLDTFRGEKAEFLILMLGTPCLVLWGEGFCLVDDIEYVLFCLPGLRENRRHPAAYLVHGAKALNNAFRGWTRKEVGQNVILSIIILLGIIPSLAFTAELNM